MYRFMKLLRDSAEYDEKTSSVFKMVCNILDEIEGKNQEAQECQTMPDRKLIDSAPELYEILQKIIANTDKLGTEHHLDFVDLFNEARKILARIDGEQETRS